MTRPTSITGSEHGRSPALPRLLLTAGEPAGIGPELCVRLAAQPLDTTRLAAVGDADWLAHQADALGLPVRIERLAPDAPVPVHRAGVLAVRDHPLATTPTPGAPDPANAAAVLATLDSAVDACRDGLADAMVTAPLQKSAIADAGIAFSGHTEYLAARLGAATPVMMLVAGRLRVALATTHLPLSAVPAAITGPLLEHVLAVLDRDLRTRFAIARPRIAVCGLNPHAGEDGHLGTEELRVIAPALERARADGLDVRGPLPADTAFTPAALAQCDAVLAMYHDQGLPVLKASGFGEAVNVTLGLPIIRTSVDHGTALDIAGRGVADPSSLRAAVELARALARDATA